MYHWQGYSLLIIQDQFGILYRLQMSPIPHTSFLVGTFFAETAKQLKWQTTVCRSIEETLHFDFAIDFRALPLAPVSDFKNSIRWYQHFENFSASLFVIIIFFITIRYVRSYLAIVLKDLLPSTTIPCHSKPNKPET